MVHNGLGSRPEQLISGLACFLNVPPARKVVQISDQCRNPSVKIIRRSESEVSKFNVTVDVTLILDIGSDLTLGSSFGLLHQIAGGEPQENGGEGQNDGEGSKNFVVPVMDKVPQAAAVSVRPNAEGADIFLKLSLGGCSFC